MESGLMIVVVCMTRRGCAYNIFECFGGMKGTWHDVPRDISGIAVLDGLCDAIYIKIEEMISTNRIGTLIKHGGEERIMYRPFVDPFCNLWIPLKKVVCFRDIDTHSTRKSLCLLSLVG